MDLIKRFIPYYRPYRKELLLDLACASVLSAIDLAFPQLLRLLRGSLFQDAPERILTHLLLFALLLILMYLVRAACRYYVTYQGHVMGAKMEAGMRRDLFDQFERFSFSWYDRNNTGEMMAKLVADLFDISELAHHGPENLFISVVKLAGAFLLLFMIHVPMTLILGAVVIVLAVFSYRQNGRMRATFYDNRKKVAGINMALQDTLGGIRVVKSFTGEAIEKEKFEKSNRAFLTSKKANYRAMAIFNTGTNFLEGMLYVTVIIAGGYFIARGSLTVEDLAVYPLYINIFVGPINVLIEFTEMLQKGASGFERYCEVMDEIPQITDTPDAAELTDTTGTIDFEDVSFTYEAGGPESEGGRVLSHISLHVKAGEKLAIVGPSGGGKTTLCSLIPRFYDVTDGAVKVDGKDVRTLTQTSLRRAIGIVQQDVYLFAGTIGENIAYGKPGASREEIEEAAAKADLDAFIASLPDGYDTYVGERGARLSGGQKQRISIARVFLKNPPILILDEATSALDNESEKYIQESLDRLAAGRTTITIAHRLSTIRGADEILVLDADGIRERGTHRELLDKNGLYAAYYRMQS